jgi:uncharacterized protein with beta-barrel porin domain
MDVTLDQQTRGTDFVGVQGRARVNGTLNFGVINAGYARTGSWQDTFLTATLGIDPSVRPVLSYAPSAVASYSLVDDDGYSMAVATTVNWVPNGLNRNQLQLANTVQNITWAGSTPGFAQVGAGLYQQPTLPLYAKALSTVSGEGVISTQSAALNTGALFSTTMLDQANVWRQNAGIDVNGVTDRTAPRDGGGDDPARSTFYGDRTWRLWAAPAAGYSTQNGDASIGSASVTQRGYGLMAGIDVQESSNLLFGAAISGSSTRFQVPDRSTNGTLNSGLLGAYVMHKSDEFYAMGTLFGGFQKTETSRVIAGVMTDAEFAKGQFNGGLIGGRLEVGYRFKSDVVSMVPFVAFQPAYYGQLRENENSRQASGAAGYAGLNYAPASGRSMPFLIGAQFETEIRTRDGSVMVPFIRLAWMHDFTPSRGMKASFINAPGFNFNVIGASQPRDALVARAGAQIKITELMRLFGSFDGVFSGQGNSYAGTIGLQMGW